MAKEPPTDLLSSLPRTRPHRRSAKRASRPQTAEPTRTKAKPSRGKSTSPGVRKAGPRLRQPAQPGGSPAGQPPARPPAGQTRPSATDILGTAVGAVTELTEIGLTLSARALRRAASRLPGA